ncbi:hypothetical protein [Bradyrhizobium australafricanum]|uniref:hypothetical protein n=1 Tax=Bradyrhizobium australafricanum TaxID=2821406 RepID=UPI001CE34DE1|nr:hypothetical protein [Bradyrhizobium australafricanum]MCA6104753.1 hypothetical protein [Bradyrhizobium australafricanum]
MSEHETLYKLHNDIGDKYVYFLLAASGTSIAFAVTQTQTATLSWSKVPLAIAVICWALSFFAGCRHIQEWRNIVNQNYDYLRIRAGIHPEFPPAAAEIIKRFMDESAKSSGKWALWQFRSLIAGAFFYILWHGVEMALRTPTTGIQLPLGYS